MANFCLLYAKKEKFKNNVFMPFYVCILMLDAYVMVKEAQRDRQSVFFTLSVHEAMEMKRAVCVCVCGGGWCR